MGLPGRGKAEGSVEGTALRIWAMLGQVLIPQWGGLGVGGGVGGALNARYRRFGFKKNCLCPEGAEEPGKPLKRGRLIRKTFLGVSEGPALGQF